MNLFHAGQLESCTGAMVVAFNGGGIVKIRLARIAHASRGLRVSASRAKNETPLIIIPLARCLVLTPPDMNNV